MKESEDFEESKFILYEVIRSRNVLYDH